MDRWPLVAGATEGVDQVVIIPALAERKRLFATLSSLAGNPAAELQRTLVICVINNRPRGTTLRPLIEDNEATLRILGDLKEGKTPRENGGDTGITRHLEQIRKRRLRVAFIDASSPGCELPERIGGVGLARKIGMDAAVAIFAAAGKERGLLLSLDADTRVEENYLPVVRSFFNRNDVHGAVIAFSHEYPPEPELREAICCYEIFLRYYVLGLSYVGSPYAFPSIGSTMACTASAYAMVRGMNRRLAGEDFYFLNKVAKVAGGIAYIAETTVHPSARPSRRAPFGTGQRMIRFLGGRSSEYELYDPGVFTIVRKWFEDMVNSPDHGGDLIFDRAKSIHPLLASFLDGAHFVDVWNRIRKNSRKSAFLRRQFHCWFDGFVTLKLVRYMTEHALPPVDMFAAVERILEMNGRRSPVPLTRGRIPPIDDQERIISAMYLDAPPSFAYTARTSDATRPGKPDLASQDTG